MTWTKNRKDRPSSAYAIHSTGYAPGASCTGLGSSGVPSKGRNGQGSVNATRIVPRQARGRLRYWPRLAGRYFKFILFAANLAF